MSMLEKCCWCISVLKQYSVDIRCLKIDPFVTVANEALLLTLLFSMTTNFNDLETFQRIAKTGYRMSLYSQNLP